MTPRPAGYLVDTNLLLLLVVGDEGRDLIAKHGRLDDYTARDYDILRNFLQRARRVMLTPNTLTETSNLLRQHGEPQRSRFMRRLRAIIVESEETVIPSEAAANNRQFERLGLTDAALVEAATSQTPLLTVDTDLFRAALRKGPGAAVHFDTIRFQQAMG